MSASAYERLMRTIRKMEPGTMGGQSRVATPVADVVEVASSTQPPAPRPSQ